MNDLLSFRVAAGSVFILLLLQAISYAQLPSSRCDVSDHALVDCPFVTHLAQHPLSVQHDSYPAPQESAMKTENDQDSQLPEAVPSLAQEQRFRWRRALTESFTFLVIEQAYVVHTDFDWVVSENGIPFNHYWRDYTQSLSEWTKSGWNDGDPNWFGYVGHPIQGALTGFIQIQNDPHSQKLIFSRTKEYWWSRFKAFLWNAAYSTQWNLGPISEVTVEKYGSKDRPPWNHNGSFPCSHNCFTGVGQIDVVMTPLGGTGWLIGEDFLDKEIVQRVEDHTQSRLLIDTFRTALNPVRAGANILHGEHPWYRASRDYPNSNVLRSQENNSAKNKVPKAADPNHGDVFVGYSHISSAHCEQFIVGGTAACDPLSAATSSLSGWDASIEKKYLRYFGAVADFSGQYGNVTLTNFLLGIRGGAWAGPVRPFAQALVGAVHASESGLVPFNPDTTFAEDLGVGVDFRLTRRLVFRNQVNELKTGSPSFIRRNVFLSSGFAVRF
jgi:hypothetical protein